MFIQYEVWYTLDGHEELLECVATKKEADRLVMESLEFYHEMWIIEDTDGETKEISRFKGL